MHIWKILEDAAALNLDRTAVVDGERTYTYRQSFERASNLAAFFIRQGVMEGERISILDDNSYAFFETYFASAGIGAILNPLNHRLCARELALILQDTKSKWLLAAGRFGELVAKIQSYPTSLEGLVWIGRKPDLDIDPPEFEFDALVENDQGSFAPVRVDENAIAHLYYTSGTTGRPKGVMLTHRNVCRHAKCAIEELDLQAGDVWGHIAPMFHLADAWATFALSWVGGSHVMVPRFDAEAALSAIEKHCVTITNLIPTMLNLMLKHESVHRYDLSKLRVVLSGGAPIAPELVRLTMATFGCDYIQTYGMTETSPYLTLSLLEDHLKRLPPDEQLRYKAKTGRPFKGVELKVVDDQGGRIEPNDIQVGEIWVRGATVTPGYWNLADETRNAFTDGWLRTGDLAVVDREGYINIVDRKKDMIVTGGENVYSTEVENVLYMHPAVLEAAVFGIADETWGEMVSAAVVPKPDTTLQKSELIQFCKQHLASYKTPKKIEFLKELPKTGSGKINKRSLREMYCPK